MRECFSVCLRTKTVTNVIHMKKIILIAAALCCTFSLLAQPKLSKDNIDEVLKAMTLEEKATLVVGSGWGSMTAGSMTASDATLVPGAAGTTRAIPRLGIPQTVLADGLRENGLEVNASIENWYKKYIDLKKTELANNSAGGFMAMLGSAVIPEMEVKRSFIEKMEKAVCWFPSTLRTQAPAMERRWFSFTPDIKKMKHLSACAVSSAWP